METYHLLVSELGRRSDEKTNVLTKTGTHAALDQLQTVLAERFHLHSHQHNSASRTDDGR